MSDLPTVRQALDRWVLALHAFGRVEEVAAAMADDAVVIRHGWDDGHGVERERFVGHDAIAEWCARSPREARFDLAGDPAPGADGWRVRYRLTFGDYENFGTWELALAADGRIRRLVHQPDDLPAEWRNGIPEGKRLPDMAETRRARLALAEKLRKEVEAGRRGPGCSVPGVAAHDHDSGHDHGHHPDPTSGRDPG
ncbi:MAG: hypothetical protein D6798_09305 [Deltaproteobacteria bacterium]|nr:MAG: hypothetical protein D6798_09305 [Deltaproteobacteria bacterium]